MRLAAAAPLWPRLRPAPAGLSPAPFLRRRRSLPAVPARRYSATRRGAPELYRLLGVAQSATLEQLRRGFLAQAR